MSPKGYMCSPAVLDKDGVSAAAIVAECASYLHAKGHTLSQQLSAIYEQWVPSPRPVRGSTGFSGCTGPLKPNW